MGFALGPLLAILKHYATAQVSEAVKQVVLDALAHEDWSHGQRTEFVIEEARKIVEQTATVVDDLVLEMLIKLYLKKYGK